MIVKYIIHSTIFECTRRHHKISHLNSSFNVIYSGYMTYCYTFDVCSLKIIWNNHRDKKRWITVDSEKNLFQKSLCQQTIFADGGQFNFFHPIHKEEYVKYQTYAVLVIPTIRYGDGEVMMWDFMLERIIFVGTARNCV